MSVVNVSVKYIRPDYENLEEWMNDDDNEYIARKGIVFINGKRFPAHDSMWANPYKINADNDRETVIELYEKYLRNLLKNEKILKKFLKLKGKTLGCWCKPEACHGDIILKLLKKYEK
jgi:hypothetical protein